MKRILKDDGIIIKITPKKEYLWELRKALNIKDYENETTIDENIKKNYLVIDKYVINEEKELTTSTLKALESMTPLAKNHDICEDIDKITIALNIYVLKVRN